MLYVICLVFVFGNIFSVPVLGKYIATRKLDNIHYTYVLACVGMNSFAATLIDAETGERPWMSITRFVVLCFLYALYKLMRNIVIPTLRRKKLRLSRTEIAELPVSDRDRAIGVAAYAVSLSGTTILLASALVQTI